MVPPIVFVLLVRLLAHLYRDRGYGIGLSMWAEDLGRFVGGHRRPSTARANPLPQEAAPVTRVQETPEQWLRTQLAALEVELREKAGEA